MHRTIIDQCSHASEQQIITETGIVCQNCGLCLDQVYSGLDLPESKNGLKNPLNREQLCSHTSDAATTLSSTPSAKRKGVNQDLDTLLTICTNASLPEKYAYNAYQLFKEIRSNVMQDKNIKKPRSFKAILIAALYGTLQREQVSFTLREICSHTEIGSNQIAGAFCRYIQRSHTLSTLHIYERFCAKLQLPKEVTRKVEKTLISYENLTNSCHNPASVVGGVIFYYCKKLKLKITLKMVSEVTGVARISISRFVRRYTHVQNRENK